MAYVYEHWRPDTNTCFYVGKGNGKRGHLIWGVRRNEHHHRIVEKLRRNGLKVEVRIILDSLSDEDAFKMEQERIAFYGIENLTNQTAGGDGLKNPTLATRQKMIDARKRILADPDFRKRHANGIRLAIERDPLRSQRIGDKRRGTKQSAETIAKRSAAMKGRKRPDVSARMSGASNPFFGQKHSEETLARISAKKRGSKLRDATRQKMIVAQRRRREVESAAGLVRTRPDGFGEMISTILRNKYAAMTPEQRSEKFSHNVGKSLSDEHKEKLRITSTGRRHTPETIEKMKGAAKKRGISPVTREANRAALTGRKRDPFKESTILKMRAAAAERERKKRERKLTTSENQLRLIA